MKRQKIFATLLITMGILLVMVGIAQLMTNDFPQGGTWRKRAFYATLKHFFDSYAVDINAWIWITFGVPYIYIGTKEWIGKSTDSNLDLSTQKKPHLLGRLRNRTPRGTPKK